MAKQFSDDKSSAKNGGKLSPFKSGQLSSEKFESAAFDLENNGDISAPFKTEYGWHIVKRIELKPVHDFEDLKVSDIFSNVEAVNNDKFKVVSISQSVMKSSLKSGANLFLNTLIQLCRISGNMFSADTMDLWRQKTCHLTQIFDSKPNN